MSVSDPEHAACGSAGDLQLRYQLKASAQFVFDYLSNMDKFVAIHPLIQKMEQVGLNEYLVHESIQVGLLPFRFTYPANVASDRTEMKVVMCATVMRLTKIQMDFDIYPNGDHCSVSEVVTLTTWLPIRFILKRLFQSQHNKLFANLEALYEAS